MAGRYTYNSTYKVQFMYQFSMPVTAFLSHGQNPKWPRLKSYKTAKKILSLLEQTNSHHSDATSLLEATFSFKKGRKRPLQFCFYTIQQTHEALMVHKYMFITWQLAKTHGAQLICDHKVLSFNETKLILHHMYILSTGMNWLVVHREEILSPTLNDSWGLGIR